VSGADGDGGRTLDGVFIDLEVDASVARDPELAAKLSEVCPVDIFSRHRDGTLQIVRENLDECVLCELCINAVPTGTVRVLKLYSGQALPA
jgi:NAD-dependent dihydropyrimidine dehydrogenase PreA subunit